MNNQPVKITSFTQLIAWQEAHKLVLMIYKLTHDFPKDEIFTLVSQMRRAAISISSNIAEGFGRQSYKEKTRFYYMAQGSLVEIQNQLIIAKDVGYLTKNEFDKIASQAITCQQLICGLIRSSKSKI